MIDEQSPSRPASSDSTREIKSSSDQNRTVLYSIPPHSATNSSPSNPPPPPLTRERNTISNPVVAPVQQNQPSRPPVPVRDTAPSSHHPLRKSPKTFRKTVSDPTALRSNDGNRAIARPPTLSEQPERREDEKGPWTAEALDFFDWWPPGRPKPC